MNVNIISSYIPENAKEYDTGYDVIVQSEPKIVGECASKDIVNPIDQLWSRIDYIEYNLQIKVAPESPSTILPPDNVNYLLLFPRSSVSKYNLLMANSIGVIDNGYRDNVCVRFKYVFQPEDYVVVVSPDLAFTRVLGKVNPEKIYKVGDKCAQLVGAVKESIYFNPVNSLNETDRTGGFGHTGK